MHPVTLIEDIAKCIKVIADNNQRSSKTAETLGVALQAQDRRRQGLDRAMERMLSGDVSAYEEWRTTLHELGKSARTLALAAKLQQQIEAETKLEEQNLENLQRSLGIVLHGQSNEIKELYGLDKL